MKYAIVSCSSARRGRGLGAAAAAEIVVIESTSARYMAGPTARCGASRRCSRPVSPLTVATEDARLIKIDGPHYGPAAGRRPIRALCAARWRS